MNKQPDIEIVILAGGKSSRMGQDKGLMLLDGKPMVTYAIDFASKLKLPLRIISNNSAYENFGYPVFGDLIVEKGPIGGLYTALKTTKHDFVFLLSCDSPFISEGIIQKLIASISDEKIIVPVSKDKIYPLCAIYPKKIELCAEKNIRNNILKMTSLINSSAHTAINIQSFLDEDPESMTNINSPDDLKTIRNKKNMETKILLFGLIAEHCKSRVITTSQATNTDELIKELHSRYPKLTNMKFFISVDRKIIHSNTNINYESEVALLPPFSGG